MDSTTTSPYPATIYKDIDNILETEYVDMYNMLFNCVGRTEFKHAINLIPLQNRQLENYLISNGLDVPLLLYYRIKSRTATAFIDLFQ